MKPPSNQVNYGGMTLSTDSERIDKACEQTARIVMESGKSKMNIFTIIGVVVVVLLVAGYFGVHAIYF